MTKLRKTTSTEKTHLSTNKTFCFRLAEYLFKKTNFSKGLNLKKNMKRFYSNLLDQCYSQLKILSHIKFVHKGDIMSTDKTLLQLKQSNSILVQFLVE